MNIVADENVDKEIVDRLRADGHDVLYVAEESAGIGDHTVLDRSLQSGAVLLTADKDFGDSFFASAYCTRESCLCASPASCRT